jgi:hypothetical protein
LDCSTCLSELGALAQGRREHPELDMVLVSTDDATRAEDAQRMLARHGLADLESWVFADPNTQLLRFEIDPQWYGELPRNYFYDNAHQRIGVSGKLQPEQLQRWAVAIRNP